MRTATTTTTPMADPMKEPVPAGSVTVLACRGCCCGTERKHPGVDHQALLDVMEKQVAGSTTRLRVTDCLGPCERSNVVAVRRGEDRFWFGNMHGALVTESLAEWAANGAKGQVPPELEIFRFSPDHEHPDA